MSANTVYSSDGKRTLIAPDLAEKLGLDEDGCAYMSGQLPEYVRFCGDPEYTDCGHLEGLLVAELRKMEEFAELTLDQANRLLQWLRDSAAAGRRFSYDDHAWLCAHAQTLG